MCFIADSDALVAPRSIRVLKLLHKNKEEVLISPIRKYSYYKDAENPIIHLSKDKDGCISEGYHAYLNEATILKFYRHFGFKTIKELEKKTPYIVGIFEIPKGTTYFVNSRNEVVSETLILRDLI